MKEDDIEHRRLNGEGKVKRKTFAFLSNSACASTIDDISCETLKYLFRCLTRKRIREREWEREREREKQGKKRILLRNLATLYPLSFSINKQFCFPSLLSAISSFVIRNKNEIYRRWTKRKVENWHYNNRPFWGINYVYSLPLSNIISR